MIFELIVSTIFVVLISLAVGYILGHFLCIVIEWRGTMKQLRKIKTHIERWNTWRKHSHMPQWYKFLVLVGIKYSPTFAIQLTKKEIDEIHRNALQYFISGRMITSSDQWKATINRWYGNDPERYTDVWKRSQDQLPIPKLSLADEFDGDPIYSKKMYDAGYDYFGYSLMGIDLARKECTDMDVNEMFPDWFTKHMNKPEDGEEKKDERE